MSSRFSFPLPANSPEPSSLDLFPLLFQPLRRCRVPTLVQTPVASRDPSGLCPSQSHTLDSSRRRPRPPSSRLFLDSSCPPASVLLLDSSCLPEPPLPPSSEFGRSCPSLPIRDLLLFVTWQQLSFSFPDSPKLSAKKMKRKRNPYKDEPTRPIKSATYGGGCSSEGGEEEGKTTHNGLQWRNLELSLAIENKNLSGLKKVELVHSYLNSIPVEDIHDMDQARQAENVSFSRVIVRISSWIQTLFKEKISSEDKISCKDKLSQFEDSNFCLDCRCWEILRYCLQASPKLGISLSLSGNLLRAINFVSRNALYFLNDTSLNLKGCRESELLLYRTVHKCIRSMFSLHSDALQGSMKSWMPAVGSVLELVTKIFAEDLESFAGSFFIDLSFSILEPFSTFLRLQRWHKNGFRDFVDNLLEPLLHLLGLLHHQSNRSNSQNLSDLIEEIISCGLFHPSHMDECLNLQGLEKYRSSEGAESIESKTEIRSYLRHLFEKLVDIVSHKKEWALVGAGELLRLFVKQVKNQKRELFKVQVIGHMEGKSTSHATLEPSPRGDVVLEKNYSSTLSVQKSIFDFLVQIMEPLLFEIKLYLQSDVGAETSPRNAQSLLRSINKMLSGILSEKIYVRTEDISEGACINFFKVVYGFIMSLSAKVIGLLLSSRGSVEIEQMISLTSLAEELVVAVGYILEIEHKVIGEGLVDLWLMILALLVAEQYFNKKSALILRTAELSCQLVNLFKELREASHAVFALCRGLRHLSFPESRDETKFSTMMSMSLLHNEVIMKSAELLMRSQMFRMTIHEALKTMPEGQASDCFHRLIIDISESLNWKKVGCSAISEPEPGEWSSYRFSMHADLLGKVFAEIYSLVLDSIFLTAGNSSSIGDALNRLITVLQPIMSILVASKQYKTHGLVIPSVGLTLKTNMLDACHWIFMFFFRLYVSCRSLSRQAISLMPPHSSLKMSAVMGDGFTGYSGMDLLKSHEIREDGYFSWISKSSNSLLGLVQSIRKNLDKASSTNSPLIYMLHPMVVQRLFDLNRRISFVQYLLQEFSSISQEKVMDDDGLALFDKKEEKWKQMLSDLEKEASRLTAFMMKSLSLVDQEEVCVTGEEVSKDPKSQPLKYSWDMGFCSIDEKTLPTAIWWNICQSVAVWCSHATEKKLKLFLSILIRSVLRDGYPPSQGIVSSGAIDASDVVKVSMQQISLDLLQDANFYELTFVRRYLAPNICHAILKLDSFPEWVEVLSTLKFSYIDEEEGAVSFSDCCMIEEFFKGGGLFPRTSFQFTVCQNLLNLLIHMPKRSLSTDSLLHCTRFVLNLERVVVRSIINTHGSLQLHGQWELYRLLVCCRRALKCWISAFSEEKNKAIVSFGTLLFGEDLSHAAIWLLKSTHMLVEGVNNRSNNCDVQANNMLFSLMDHTAGVLMILGKYYYSCSIQLHCSGLDCKANASIRNYTEDVNACRIINIMAELLRDRLNDAVKNECTEDSFGSIHLNKMSSLLSSIQGFLWGVAGTLNDIDTRNCIIEVSGECESISKINQCIETTSDFMDCVLKKFLINEGHMIKSICDAQQPEVEANTRFSRVESSIQSCTFDGNNSEHLDSEKGKVLLALPEFDSANGGGRWKNLLQGFLGSQNVEYLFFLRELFSASSAILRLLSKTKCSPPSSSLMNFLLGILQEILLEFANMDQVPKGFWLVLDCALKFMEELGHQYALSYLTMTESDLVKLVRLHIKAIGKCISLQQKAAKLASHETESSTKTQSSQLEGVGFLDSHAVYGVAELKARLRMSFKMLIKNSLHLESAVEAVERALVGVQEGCTMIYEIAIGKGDGGMVSSTVAAGIDCLDLILECVEGRRPVKEKLHSLTASLFNIVIHLQGPSIFYRNLICGEKDINPDPGAVVLMCVEVLTRVSRKDTLFQIDVGNRSKNMKKIDVGQFLKLPAALFHDFCHLLARNQSTAPISWMTPAANASDVHLVDQLFSIDLYAACCRLLCTVLKHRHSEAVKRTGLLQYSVEGLLNCLEMTGIDLLEGDCTWTLEEGIKCACNLRRVYEEIRQQKLFKEHCLKFLSNYISVYSGFGPLRKGLKREIDEAMRPGVYALIDACSEQNLQCLHTEFGEGPCRSILASLRHDYKLNYQYHGKV